MKMLTVKMLLSAALVASLLTGCSRGCSTEPPRAGNASQAIMPVQVPSETTATRVEPMRPADAIEAQFGFELPDRITGKVFPAMSTFPYRRLGDFDVGRNLVVRLNHKGLDVLQQHVDVADWHDETELRKVFRLAGEQWAQRSGVTATRLYLVVEHGLDARVAGRVRRIAMTSGTWRVVGLARDGDHLMELLLSPAPRRRREGPTEVTP
jgi:hypothetical protein